MLPPPCPLPPAGRSPTVSASTSTPRGPISIKAVRDNARGLVSVAVDAPVPGVVGLRLFDEASGCALDLATASLDGRPAALQQSEGRGAAAGLPGRLHLTMAEQHAYVAVAAGRHTVTAAFASHCAAALAASQGPAAAAVASPAPMGFPSVPPFAAPTYPGTWSTDIATGGNWVGKYGKAGYQLFAMDAESGADIVKLPSWVHSVGGKNGGPVPGCASTPGLYPPPISNTQAHRGLASG